MHEYKHDSGRPKLKMFKGFNVKNPFEGELDKPNNVFDVKSCHVGKIKLHNRNMKRLKKLHPYLQRSMIH